MSQRIKENLPFLESGFASVNKQGEALCGDFFTTADGSKGKTVVLSDGLGSGVKANILATLTAKILSTMMSSSMSMEESVATAAKTLPVCKIKKLAYSTFTMVQFRLDGKAYLAQFDNPAAILLRQGKSISYEAKLRKVDEKDVYVSMLALQPGDMLIIMTDGVTNAGVGKGLEEGWKRENVISFIERKFASDMTAQNMADAILSQCLAYYRGKPDDDTTIAVFGVKKRTCIKLFIGPPLEGEKSEEIAQFMKETDAVRLILGEGTARVIAGYLHRPLQLCADPEDPEAIEIARMDGIDKITEGMVTVERLANAAKYWNEGQKETQGAAADLAKWIFDLATDVIIYVGQAENPAYRDKRSEISRRAKEALIGNLEKTLRQMGKKVELYFC